MADVIRGEASGPGAGVKIKEEPVEDNICENDGTNKNDEQTRDENKEANLSQLIAENERLQRIFGELNNRQSILEEFIEVEYGEKFDSFLTNRERLVNVMGLGQGENADNVDGKRSAKSLELAKLLKVVKSQAEANNSDVTDTAGSSTAPRGHQGQQKRGGYNPHYHGGKRSRGGGNFNRYY